MDIWKSPTSKKWIFEKFEKVWWISEKSGGYQKMSGGYQKKSGGYQKMSGGYLKKSGGYLKKSGGYLIKSGGYLKKSGGCLKKQQPKRNFKREKCSEWSKSRNLPETVSRTEL